MSANRRISKALALLIPVGVLGISSALATMQAEAEATSKISEPNPFPVADRLRDIRSAVSLLNASARNSPSAEPKLLLADWLNVGGGLGWRNGGWGNGGWHNAGWGNGGWGNGGWHNAGWGNGGWHNAGWGNGGWRNFWHNW